MSEGFLQEKMPWWFYMDWVFLMWLAVPISLFVGYAILAFLVKLFPIGLHVSFYLALVVVQGLIAGYRTRHSIADLINRKIGNHWLLIYMLIFLTPAVIEVILGQGNLMIMGVQNFYFAISLVRILFVSLSLGSILAYFHGLVLNTDALKIENPPYELRKLNIATIVGILTVESSNAALLFTYFWSQIIT